MLHCFINMHMHVHTCVYIHVHTWIQVYSHGLEPKMSACVCTLICRNLPNYTHTHTHTRRCVCMYTRILLNFSQLQLGRIGSLCLMHPSGPLGASEGKHLWSNFMTPSCCLGKVDRAAEADGRANQQVFYVWGAVRCSFIS